MVKYTWDPIVIRQEDTKKVTCDSWLCVIYHVDTYMAGMPHNYYIYGIAVAALASVLLCESAVSRFASPNHVGGYTVSRFIIIYILYRERSYLKAHAGIRYLDSQQCGVECSSEALRRCRLCGVWTLDAGRWIMKQLDKVINATNKNPKPDKPKPKNFGGTWKKTQSRNNQHTRESKSHWPRVKLGQRDLTREDSILIVSWPSRVGIAINWQNRRFLFHWYRGLPFHKRGKKGGLGGSKRGKEK